MKRLKTIAALILLFIAEPMICNNVRDESLIDQCPTFKRWFDRVTYEVTE